MVAVREYERADGTKVRSHTRWHPGARNEMFKAAVFVVAVIAIGGGTGGNGKTGTASTEGSVKSPKPVSTAVYPVHFPGWDKPGPRPSPTVSYPIRWDRGE
ncbi:MULTISPECIES: hypothetical protein [unclassified Streptomyces]|uniref:hypothetical protein n=1 Tax=unclassified Streptomyces TaxID=2593676 RepID=UPI0038299DE9